MIKFTLIFIVLVMVFNVFIKLIWYPYYEDEIKRHCLGLGKNYKAILPLFIAFLLNIAAFIFAVITIITAIVQFL